MDATTAMFTWMTLERMLVDAAQDSGGSFREHAAPEGSYCSVEFESGVVIELFDCNVMDVAYLTVVKNHTEVLTLTCGEDHDIYRSDFVLDHQPPMCRLKVMLKLT